ncbi:phosphoenolpyruvate carboxykinase [candidate division KSB1 bacterium]|nr:phosphoenolpyruvate carboxykinase [candidate division KSB1 bacterium]
MKTAYSLTANKIIIDYSSVYCETPEKLLRSKPFADVTSRYLEKIASQQSPVYLYFCRFYSDQDLLLLSQDVIATLKLLTTHRVDEVSALNPSLARLLSDPTQFYEFVEGLYNFWRTFERYITMAAPKTRLRTRDSIHHASFIRANETFRLLILRTYRIICDNLVDSPFRVYRQLPAGAQFGFMQQHVPWDCPLPYESLRKIPFIRLTLLEPPVIFYPRKNKRSGLFRESLQNPVEDMELHPESWFCYPAKIGKLLAFTYFHKEFMCHGTSLANLFELANYEDIYDRRPDIIMIFGGSSLKYTDEQTIFHQDHRNGILVGYVVGGEQIDYFGYMKKMLLTLHNIIMLDRNMLPVHGAMVTIQLKCDVCANVVIIGDSGAGKSETLEAFRILAGDYIRELSVIFDDMGSLDFSGPQVLGFGTETGAFLRLDDLQPGYAFEQFDRSIFMSPNLTNARVILPVTTYRRIVQGEPIDFFLYANNYEAVDNDHPALDFFQTSEEALAIFRCGRRQAKGTTSESGVVESYFANPFGAPQRRELHEKLAAELMQKLFDTRVCVGQLRTQLGIEGMAQNGPQQAARVLFDWIGKKKESPSS